MAKNSGLGKGLDALFSESKVLSEMKKEVAQSDDDRIKNIKIVDIEPNPTQARKKFDEEALNELAASNFFLACVGFGSISTILMFLILSSSLCATC